VRVTAARHTARRSTRPGLCGRRVAAPLVGVIHTDDLIDALIRTYLSLPEELRAELPLKEIWTFVDEGSSSSS
jgi:hypothetical protein